MTTVSLVEVAARDGLQNDPSDLATEDVAYLLERMGVETGLCVDGLIAGAHWLAERLGHSVPGTVSRAGNFPQPGDPRTAR